MTKLSSDFDYAVSRRTLLKSGAAAAAATASLGFPAIARSQQQKRYLKPIVAGLNGREGDPTYNSIADVPKILREKYDVEMKFEIHPSMTLGSDLAQLESVQTGFIDITSNVTTQFSQFDKSFDAFDLPYVISDWDMALRVAKSDLWKRQAAAFEKKVPVKVLPPVGAGGFRLLSNNIRPTPTPAEVRGIKYRSVTSPLDIELIRAWNGSPTPMPWVETYTALQQRVVEGIHVQPIWTVKFNMFEVLKYATEVKANFSMQFQVMNMNTWKSIPEAIQKPLWLAFEEAAQRANEADRNGERGFVTELTKKGMAIYDPSPAEMKLWRTAGETVWETAGKSVDRAVINELVSMRTA